VLDHITIRVADREAAERFYDTVLQTLGIDRSGRDDDYTVWKGQFSLAAADGDATTNLHIGFVAPSRQHVDEFWRVGTEAGYRSDGEPGERPQYRPDYYGSFLLDPDGNSVEAVHHGSLRADGTIDHLWIRVADVHAARAFYETIAPHAGFRLHRGDVPDPPRSHFRGASGSFSVVLDGRPTQNVHLAFPAADDATVDAFHHAATASGYRDNGAPGERREYHPGYYAGFVLDPDGNNVEVVNHNR
jgi:catechol 2,3-dioxygenase-like lactoylglutathione lyase family enzyme